MKIAMVAATLSSKSPKTPKMKMSYPKPRFPLFAAALSGCCVLLLTAAVPVSAQSKTPQPGGTINWVTKKPSFSGNFGSISAEGGQWDSNFGSIDINHVISPSLAARIVLAGVDGNAYTGEPRRGFIAMPEITWRRGSAQLLLQAQIYNYKTFVNSGVPLDYTIGTASNVRAKDMIPAGVPWATY